MSSNTIMLVFGDGRHGHNLACELCCFNDEHNCFEQILIVVDKSFEKYVKDIKGKKCKIIPIDFNKHKEGENMQVEMDRVMAENKPDWLLLIPYGDTCTPEAMKCSMECFKKKGGKNVIMCSKSLAEEANEEPVCRLKCIEKLVQNTFPKTSAIVQNQMAMMDLDYFIEDVKEKQTWRLPLGNGRFSPISLCDAIYAIGTVCKNKEFRPEWAGKTFKFTNTDKIDGNRLAEMTSTALNVDTKFEAIKLEEACDVLKKFLWHENAGGVDRADKKGCMHRKLTSKMEAHVLLFSFKMIMAGKYDCVTKDYKELTGKEPMPVEEYLRKNQDRFKGSN